MAMRSALKASETLTADSPQGQETVAVFRAQYNKAKLDPVRGQILIGNKAFAAGLARLLAECSLPITAPQGGRIHMLRVPVNQGRMWQEAVEAVGPDTGKSWDVWKVGEHYPPQPAEPKEEEIILVNFGKTIPTTQHALDWAKPLGLVPKDPRSVFAVGEHKPLLHRDLGNLIIISPLPCWCENGQQVSGVWLNDFQRFADLRWFNDNFLPCCWFAFGRE